MSLFSPKKKTYVSSVVYNMAGEYTERTNYLRYLLFNGVANPQGNSLGETLNNGNLNGPYMNYRAFSRWATKRYPTGVPDGGFIADTRVDVSLVLPHIPVAAGNYAMPISASVGSDEYHLWAENYIADNYPDRINQEWEAFYNEYDESITVTFPDSLEVTFTPVGYEPRTEYLLAVYQEAKDSVSDEELLVQAGEEFTTTNEANLPSTAGYVLTDEYDDTASPIPLRRRVNVLVTYSDSRPDEDTNTVTSLGTYPYNAEVQEFSDYLGLRRDPLDTSYSYWAINRLTIEKHKTVAYQLVSDVSVNETLTGGVIKTTRTRTYEEAVTPTAYRWLWHTDLYMIDNGTLKPPRNFLYKKNSGNVALDGLFPAPAPLAGYFPMIPIRTDNVMIDEGAFEDTIYPMANKAWKRASGGRKIDTLLSDVRDNDDLTDIDYAFIIWGVPLNTKTKEGRHYIYRYFREFVGKPNIGNVTFDAYAQYQADMVNHAEAVRLWEAQDYPHNPYPTPPVNPYGVTGLPPGHTETMRTSSEGMDHYHMEITFNSVSMTSHTGKFKVGARRYDTELIRGSDIVIPYQVVEGGDGGIYNYDRIHETLIIKHQVDTDTWEELQIIDPRHTNYVYNGHTVENSVSTALEDDEDSGFIIPMSLNLLNQMSLVHANQLATEGMLIVFNAYTIVKKKWYQTFLGAIVIALVTMGVGAVISGTGAILSGSGLLGANAAIGAMFGFAGLTGALIGAAVNAIAATLLTSMVGELTQGMGALGSLFQAVFSIMAGNFMTGGFSNLMSFDILFRADNLLKMTNALIGGVGDYVSGRTKSIMEELTELNKEFSREKSEVDSKLYELVGNTTGADAMILTEVLNYRNESREEFLSRTLLTGMDIADMSMAAITRYPEASLNLIK